MLDKTPGLKDLTEGKELVLHGLEMKDVLKEDPVPASFPIRVEGMVKVVFRITREDSSLPDPISDLAGITLEATLAGDRLWIL